MIGQLDHLNNACLGKLSWKVLTNEDNWWVQLTRMKYLKHEDLWDIKTRQNYSLAWKGILDCRDVLMKGMRWIEGNGQNILF